MHVRRRRLNRVVKSRGWTIPTDRDVAVATRHFRDLRLGMKGDDPTDGEQAEPVASARSRQGPDLNGQVIVGRSPTGPDHDSLIHPGARVAVIAIDHDS